MTKIDKVFLAFKWKFLVKDEKKFGWKNFCRSSNIYEVGNFDFFSVGIYSFFCPLSNVGHTYEILDLNFYLLIFNGSNYFSNRLLNKLSKTTLNYLNYYH